MKKTELHEKYVHKIYKFLKLLGRLQVWPNPTNINGLIVIYLSLINTDANDVNRLFVPLPPAHF